MTPDPSPALEGLYKSIQTFISIAITAENREKLWKYNDALMQSLHSILEDSDCDEAVKMEYFNTTMEQYTAAMKSIFPLLISDYSTPKTNESHKTIGKSSPDRFDTIQEVEKFNPYHDAKGRFATAQGYSSFTIHTKDPGKQHMANRAIAREKERNAAAGSKDEGKAKITAAEDKIRGMLKDGATVKLEGVDPEMADSIAASIETVLKRYPSTKDAFEGFTTDDTDKGSFKEENGVMGCFVPRTGMIHLNASYYGDKAAFEKKFQDGVDKQFHPKGLTADSVVVHEMGHAIDTYVSKKCIPAMDYNWGGERVSSRIWNNAIKNGKKNNEPVTGKSIREGLSGYAGKNHSEYLAEGFAEFVMSRNPRPLATKIGKDLERYIKKAEKA